MKHILLSLLSMVASPHRSEKSRSLLPLLKNPQSEWAERPLVYHTGRWANGKAAKQTQHSNNP